MIDPQTIIKSQIANDKYSVNLNEILEKYGTQNEEDCSKSITLQFYSKEVADDSSLQISSDTDIEGYIIPNGAITITKRPDDNLVWISGLIVDDMTDMQLLRYIEIRDGDCENGIIVQSDLRFDVHVIKV